MGKNEWTYLIFMKVLFVLSGNSKYYDISPFLRSQGDSLKQHGVDIHYFTINEVGVKGYIKNGFKLRKYLAENRFDLIHAHYCMAGWSAVIGSGKIPVVLSLMGSDAYGEYIGEKQETIQLFKYTVDILHTAVFKSNYI